MGTKKKNNNNQNDEAVVIPLDLEDEIEDVMVPTEEVVEIRRGQKVNVERRFMPGYVLVKMEMTDRAYHLINDTPRVTGFLGPQGRPTP